MTSCVVGCGPAGMSSRTPVREMFVTHLYTVATAAADPPEDPPGLRRVSHGLRAGPNSAGSVTAFAPNSGVLVLPKTTRPASSHLCTTVECWVAGTSARPYVSAPRRSPLPPTTIGLAASAKIGARSRSQCPTE